MMGPAPNPTSKADDYFQRVTAACCGSTVAGWLWYCDEHDTHGNADSEEEAWVVGGAHSDYHADGEPDLACDIRVAPARKREVIGNGSQD